MSLKSKIFPLITLIMVSVTVGNGAFGTPTGRGYELSQSIDGPIEIEIGFIEDAKGRTLEALVNDWNLTNASYAGVYFFFPRNEDLAVSIQRLLDSDPWMYVEYEVTNTTDFEIFYSMVLRMETDVISGPTQVDAFMDLELIDTDGNEYVQSRNTSARFDVTDDPGGDTVNDLQTIAQSPGGGFQLYAGEGVHSVFNVVGPGPNSNNVAETNGYNMMTFFLNGQLSFGDTVRIKASACYAMSLDLCPTREDISQLNLIERSRNQNDPEPIPVPPSWLLLLGGLVGVLGFGRRGRLILSPQ